jgi:glucosamine-6-phosphate deaminase
MTIENESETIQRFQVGRLKLEVHESRKAAGKAAAKAIAENLRQLERDAEDIAVIFATGMSQLETLRALTSVPDLPWKRIRGFHLDEYIGIDANHPASFRRYLRENLTERVGMREFFEIDGNALDANAVCREYAQKLLQANPQICQLGFGENGHLAFNDPGEADFNDPEDVKVVHLDAVCRQQQASEGWFKTLQDVPTRAITVTIPAVLRVPKLILTIPGNRKARIVRRALEEPISPDCPATILRTHPDATAYLDTEAAAEWLGSK